MYVTCLPPRMRELRNLTRETFVTTKYIKKLDNEFKIDFLTYKKKKSYFIYYFNVYLLFSI